MPRGTKGLCGGRQIRDPRPHERGINCRPVYVLGVAHSGTSILRKMLAYHPEATWFSQYSLRDGSVEGRRRVPFAHAADRALRCFVRYDWRMEKGSRCAS